VANLAKHNIGQLTALVKTPPGGPGVTSPRATQRVKTRLRRTQYRPGVLDGFLAKTGLDLSNLHY
jgi:hypothetical protein